MPTNIFVSTTGVFEVPGCFDLLLLPCSTNHAFALLKGVSVPIQMLVFGGGCSGWSAS